METDTTDFGVAPFGTDLGTLVLLVQGIGFSERFSESLLMISIGAKVEPSKTFETTVFV